MGAAISTSVEVTSAACGAEPADARADGAAGSVCVMLGERGVRLAMPPDVNATSAGAIADWLGGMLAQGERAGEPAAEGKGEGKAAGPAVTARVGALGDATTN